MLAVEPFVESFENRATMRLVQLLFKMSHEHPLVARRLECIFRMTLKLLSPRHGNAFRIIRQLLVADAREAQECHGEISGWAKAAVQMHAITSLRMLKSRLHDTTGCQSGLTSGWTRGCIVYTNIQPVVKPVIQPAVQLYSRLDNRFDSRLYRVNGVSMRQ